MKSDEAALNNFYDYVAKAGGPTDPIELEQKLIGSRVPHLVDLGLKAQSTRLENDKYQAYKKSLAPPVAAAAVPSAFSEDMSQNVTQANAALPSWAPTNKLAPQPSVNTMAAEPTLRDLQAQYSELARFTAPQARAEMDVIKLRIADKMKTQVVGPGASVVRDGVVSYTAPVAGSPLARLESERAAFPPGDPRISTWTAAINEISIAPGAHRKITENQGEERNRIARARLNIEQNRDSLGLAEADVPLIMAAVDSGKLNPDKLNGTTAPMYAKLLKANPYADFVGAGNAAAAARTGAVTGARIASRQVLTDVDATQAENIARGNLPPATGPNAGKIMNEVVKLNPEYNSRDFGLQTSAEKEFNIGKDGNKTRSLNVAVSHLTTLETAAAALRAGDVRAFNQFKQAWQRETGKSAPTDFNAVRELVADEIVAAVVPGVGALADRKALKETILSRSSPEQLQGAVKYYKELLGGQLGGLEKQYNASTRKTDFRQRYLTPEAIAALTPGQNAPVANAARPAGVTPDWTFETDAKGNTAWVSPDRKSFKEAQ